jgi:predicted nucleic acid-binding protein
MNLLLDTNRLSDVLAGIQEAVATVEQAALVRVPPIVLGEIRYGFLRGRRARENEENLRWFLSQAGVGTVRVGDATADRYAAICLHLRKRGTPIPTNDIWIAASALEHGLAVYTRDAHFAEVPGLARV